MLVQLFPSSPDLCSEAEEFALMGLLEVGTPAWVRRERRYAASRSWREEVEVEWCDRGRDEISRLGGRRRDDVGICGRGIMIGLVDMIFVRERSGLCIFNDGRVFSDESKMWWMIWISVLDNIANHSL